MAAGLVEGRLSRQTLAVTGPEEMLAGEAIRRVAQAKGRGARLLPAPVCVHFAFARMFEKLMTIPLVSRTQVRILAEGLTEPMPPCDPLPEDLLPQIRFTEEQIIRGLPAVRAFGFHDLRLCTPALSMTQITR